jgi:Cu2+-containing amine oxidase
MKVKTTNKGMLGQETDPINPFLPLTEKEQNSISSYFLNNILTDAVIGPEVILDLVSLKEPVKKEVLKFYETGVMPQRVAEVGVFYYTTDTYLSYNVVLVNGEIEKVSEPVTIKDARPSYNVPEEDLCYELIFSNEEFRNVLKLRGLTDYDIDNYVTLDTCFDSRMDLIDNKFGPNFSDFIYNRNPRPRIVYFAPFWSSGIPDTSKYYVQPIDEILVFVDTLSKEIIKIYDSGTFDPIQKENVFWERPESNTLKPPFLFYLLLISL